MKVLLQILIDIMHKLMLVFIFAIIWKIKDLVEEGGGGWDEVSVTLLGLAPEELVGFLGQAQVVMYLGI